MRLWSVHHMGLAVSLVLACVGVTAQTRAWTRTYNGTGNGRDAAYAVAVDAVGNTYVTGESLGIGSVFDYDYCTIKYDPNGNELWVRRYNGQVDSLDEARGLAVDAAGNAYVTGWSDDAVTGCDFCTIKYDSNGNELWVRRHHGPGNGWDQAYAIALDASGNACVTGESGLADCTIKYDPNGNELWVGLHHMTGNENSSANSIALDAAGNAFVTGFSNDTATGGDYCTIKYDTDGNVLWVRRYNGPGNEADWARAIAVDPAGNAYVTGESGVVVGGTNYVADYCTIKYGPDGNELWVRRYDGAGNWDDEARAIAVDAAGNAYVTGYSYGVGNLIDCCTIKYGPSGNELWERHYSGFPEPASIAVDTSGSVFVAGVGYTQGPRILKYDTNGDLVWVDTISGDGGFTCLGVDRLGNVIAAGEVNGDYETAKYLSDTVTGRLTFESLASAANPPSGVIVDIRANGQPWDSRLLDLDPDGSYSLPLPPGEYDLSVKQTHWLRRTLHADTHQGGVSGVDFDLINGDANSDNNVGLIDLAHVLHDWQLGVPISDLDGSGSVGFGDLSIVLKNFGRQGDP